MEKDQKFSNVDEMSTMSQLTKAINGLSFSLYKELSKDPGNVFFSPFSISTALSMLLCGARGHTEREMREVLHFESANIASSEVHQQFDQLLSVFTKCSGGIILSFANALLSQKDMAVSRDFKETIEKSYRALLMEVDFAQENTESVSLVNEWVEKNTNGMIPKMIDSLDPSTIMVLINAVYFKGSWKQPFNPKRTRPGVFYNNGQQDQGKEVPMMFTDKKFLFVERETYKALELPYENEAIVMMLLLPKEANGIENLENMLTTDLVKDTMNALHRCQVHVTLPKFEIEYSKEMKETLVKLGMASAFEGSANFSGVNSVQMCVSDVVTKSVLVVNEEGSEAAAATAVMVLTCGMLFNEEFKADHPFLSIIYDKEKDMLLFIGRITEF